MPKSAPGPRLPSSAACMQPQNTSGRILGKKQSLILDMSKAQYCKITPTGISIQVWDLPLVHCIFEGLAE